MSNRNDKILAGSAVGLLLIAVAVWIFVLEPLVPGDAEHDPRLKSQTAQLAGDVYPPTPRADIFGFSSNWERPEENDEGWNYDIFDSVETVWDEQLREYQPKSYMPPVIPPFASWTSSLPLDFAGFDCATSRQARDGPDPLY
jgi:hypothetical protein